MKPTNNPFANVEWMPIVYEMRDGLERQPKPFDDVEECSRSSSLGGVTVAYKLVRRRENISFSTSLFVNWGVGWYKVLEYFSLIAVDVKWNVPMDDVIRQIKNSTEHPQNQIQSLKNRISALENQLQITEEKLKKISSILG